MHCHQRMLSQQSEVSLYNCHSAYKDHNNEDIVGPSGLFGSNQSH